MTTIFLSAALLAAVPSHMPTAQLAAVVQEPSSQQAVLPDAAVFFLPKSSALSPLARDVVAQAARRADSATIVIIRANHDREAGETARTALFRGHAVRDELIRDGVPKSAIRTLISDATGTGIEARRVVVSVIPTAREEYASWQHLVAYSIYENASFCLLPVSESRVALEHFQDE
jgi:hypothetical protein